MKQNTIPARLHVEQLSRDQWRLMSDFVFIDDEVGRIRVPAGFVTDFASVPRLPLMYSMMGGYGIAAAVIHDYLYRTGSVSRRAADDVFYRALRETGHARWRAWLMWAGVHIGGRSSYGLTY